MVAINDVTGVENKVSIGSVITVVVLVLLAMAMTWGLILIPFVICWVVANKICDQEIARVRTNAAKFNKNFPFRHIGVGFGDFQHVFYHDSDIRDELLARIREDLAIRTAASRLESVTITDVDEKLQPSESRQFYRAGSGTTRWGSTVTLVMSLSLFGKVHSIRWWALVGGYIDRDKRFRFVAYAPLSIWFWIIPYLRKQYDVLSKLRTIYSASYNDQDVITLVRCLHDTVFSAMIAELEEHGIDTSDIKAQRLQVMNISISGGRVNMGNVVQGAMNRVMAPRMEGAH